MTFISVILMLVCFVFGASMLRKAFSIAFATWAMPDWANLIMGGLLILFGLFNAYRVWLSMRKKNEEAKAAYDAEMEKARAKKRSIYLEDDIDVESEEYAKSVAEKAAQLAAAVADEEDDGEDATTDEGVEDTASVQPASADNAEESTDEEDKKAQE